MDLPDTIGALYLPSVDRIDIRVELWRAAKISAHRLAVDVELHVQGELAGLVWHLYTPEPAGQLGEVLAGALYDVRSRPVQ